MLKWLKKNVNSKVIYGGIIAGFIVAILAPFLDPVADAISAWLQNFINGLPGMNQGGAEDE